MLPMSRHHFKTGVIALVSQPLMRTCANFRVQGHSVFRQQGNEECIDDSSGMPGCSNRHRTRDIWHILKPGTLEPRNTWYVKQNNTVEFGVSSCCDIPILGKT